MDRRAARRDADMAKSARRRERPKERWLLTRKTWKYMSDAGRRLIPEGSQNRPEDIPKIEAYFQDVCQREPRFLLWRKSSYPGAIPKPRRKKRIRGGSVRERSPSDDVTVPTRPTDLLFSHTSGGRFDMAKMRRDFFTSPSGLTTPFGSRASPTIPVAPAEDEDENTLVDLLRKYLKLEEDSGSSKIAGNDELVRTLRRYLKKQSEPTDSDSNPTQRTLLENLSRYYCRSPNRDNIVQDLLTDRNLLKRLYHDLRKTRPYRGSRGGGSGYYPGPSTYISGLGRSTFRRTDFIRRVEDGDELRSPPTSPPPLIEVSHESLEDRHEECGTQTLPIPEEVLLELRRAYRDKLEAQTAPTSPTSPPPGVKPARRRSSVDHDDVSQSVSDTIKRYLRMARKKSVDADKADRFKRINYDKNLRNIKPKSVVDGDVDDDGPHKGCQTEEGWVLTYRELRFTSVASSPTSPPPSPLSPSTSQGFLSSLLGRGAPTPPPGGSSRGAPTTSPPSGGMQKSRSSSSVVSSVSKRLWRTRSRSSSRVSASWTPQGSCCWTDGSGRCVRLPDSSLLTLSEVERRALQQAALARLQQLNLGTVIRIPEENASVPATKPKRRAYLLKRKALTTGFFDQRAAKDGEKDKESPPGSIFGVPLAQCVETERALRRLQHGGSRASLASLGALDKGDDPKDVHCWTKAYPKDLHNDWPCAARIQALELEQHLELYISSESCDSGEWGGSALEEAGGGGPRVPALVSACLAHLRRHGLRTLGLFRVSASKKRVRQLREEWERGQEAALDAAVCPHDVATLLKEFLRDLPDPLLCRDLYSAFLNTQKIRNRRLQWEALKLIVQLLPAAHRDTLNALLSFLAELASNSEDGREPGNKMDVANLATVFAPNILHRNKPNDSVSSEQLSERADVINVVRQLVERQAELWTLPAELLHEAYIHLAHTAPQHLDALLPRRAECAAQEAAVGADGAARRVWSRETFLHGAAATATHVSESGAGRRRTRDAASDTSSGSLSSAMTIVTGRVRSSEECASSGVVCSPPAVRDSNDSNDSASDYNETLGGSDDDNCVITASLHIPAAFPQTTTRAQVTAPPRRRSTSGSESSAKRDSAVGSSSASASNASSPPASPPPAPLKVTMTSAGEIRRPADIDKLMNIGRERNTSDARAVVLRQHDENVKRSTSNTRISSHHTSRHDPGRHEQNSGRLDHSSSRHDMNSGRLDHSSSRHDMNSGRLDHSSSRHDMNSGRLDHSSSRHDMNSGRHNQNSGRHEHSSGRLDQNSGRLETRKEDNLLRKDGSSTMLYKRGELISSARTHHSHPT